jgi:hypothetical protein
MSRPTDIYDHFSRPLLNNFTWQLQNTVVDYEHHIEQGIAAGSSLPLYYAYECPDLAAASQLQEYILYQAPDEIRSQTRGDTVALVGHTDGISFDLPLLLKWVGYMCDAGSRFGCRFDGWHPNEPRPLDTGAAAQAESLPVETLPSEPTEYPHRVIVRIPERLDPLDRTASYEAPLSAALKPERLGEVTGGGTQLGENGDIAHIEVELSLANLDSALAATKKVLRKAGAPAGTELHVFAFSIIPITE